MRQEKPKTIYQSQQGVVSIIVVSILTVTLALIAVGFSRLSDRELSQASNRESAAQAYYAAQSGINDALAYIRDHGSSFTGCTNWPTVITALTPADGSKYFTTDLSGGSNIAKYSCIGVDSIPPTLINTVTPGQPWVVKIDSSNLKYLYIGWENSSYQGSPSWLGPPLGKLPNEVSFPVDQTGVLRTQIYSVDRSTIPPNTNNSLEAGSRAYYLYPDQGPGHINICKPPLNPSNPNPGTGCVDYSAGGYSATGSPNNRNGIFVSGVCKNNAPNPKPDPSGNNQGTPTYCNSEITHLDGSVNTYYLYFTAQYAPLKVVIQGTDASGAAVKFTGAQSVIDVTGQAAGQIQRVRARVGLSAQFNEPNYAVQSMESLCKSFVMQIDSLRHYQVIPGIGATSQDSTGCVVPSVGGNIVGPPDTAGH